MNGNLKLTGNDLTEILNDALGNKNLGISIEKIIEKNTNGAEVTSIEFMAGGIYEIHLGTSYRKLKD